MADYDAGEVSDRERLAADRQKEIAHYNHNTLKDIATYNRNNAINLAEWNSKQQGQLANKGAEQTREIAEYNANKAKEQFDSQLGNYDFANRQNAALRDTEFKQASRKSEAERFEAQRNLRNAALGLFGSMNQAMNGSSIGNAMSMLRDRNDADNSTHWQQLQDNRNAIQNAYDESYNQNQVAKRDAAINAIKSLNDIQAGLSSDLGNIQNDYFANLVNIRSDVRNNLANILGDELVNRRNLQADRAANLNNINPNLYEAFFDDSVTGLSIPTGYYGENIPEAAQGYVNDMYPYEMNYINEMHGFTPMEKRQETITRNPIYQAPGTNSVLSNLENSIRGQLNSINENNPTLLNYIMPENAEQDVRNRRNTLRGNDYYSRLINGYNNRR